MIKERNIVVCILLSIITCGIYGIYWFITFFGLSIITYCLVQNE